MRREERRARFTNRVIPVQPDFGQRVLLLFLVSSSATLDQLPRNSQDKLDEYCCQMPPRQTSTRNPVYVWGDPETQKHIIRYAERGLIVERGCWIKRI
jgi:hypothetical protein